METPKNCFIDFETVPYGEKDPIEYPPVPTREDILIGNRKPETAEFYRNEQYPKLLRAHEEKCRELNIKEDEKYRKRALVSMQSEIICLAYAFDDGPIKVLSGKEEGIILAFEGILQAFGDKRYAITFVGHNIKEFDLKLLYHRAVKYKVENLINHLNFLHRDLIFDTMERWGYFSFREMNSLDSILKYLGIGGKGDIDGSMVFDLFLAGKIDEICDYCKGDVKNARNLYKAMAS